MYTAILYSISDILCIKWMFVIHKGMAVRAAMLCPAFCMCDVANKTGLCGRYQTHHW